MAKYIVKIYFDFPFQIVEHDPKSKTIAGRRTSSILMAPYTEERWQAVQEWNNRIEEHRKFLSDFHNETKKLGFK